MTLVHVNMNNIPTSVTMVTKLSRLYSTLAAQIVAYKAEVDQFCKELKIVLFYCCI